MYLESAQIYPLTGARGITPVFPILEEGGLVHDRRFVVYDPISLERISTKASQCPGLHRINPLDEAGTVLDFCDENGESEDEIYHMPLVDSRKTMISEFGDQTPVYDLGSETAGKFSAFLGREVRVARKVSVGFAIAPQDRANAPLHIVTSASLGQIAAVTGLSSFEVMRRVRPNFVINTDSQEALSENNWREIKIGSAIIRIDRFCLRCEVPSQDAFTGENMKDVAKAFRTLPKAPNAKGRLTPLFGLYGHMQGEGKHPLFLGDDVEVIACKEV